METSFSNIARMNYRRCCGNESQKGKSIRALRAVSFTPSRDVVQAFPRFSEIQCHLVQSDVFDDLLKVTNSIFGV